MGFIENTFHPDRKREQNWRRFSHEAGGIFVVEGVSGGSEVHIPFMGHQIQLSTYFDRRVSRTVLTSEYSSDEFKFKIFGWGGRNVPKVDRDPYLNSEYPDLAPRMKVEFNDSNKLTSLLASPDLRQSLLECPAFFTLEAKPDLLSLDNRAHGSKDNGIVIDLNQLHAAFNIFRCAMLRLEAVGSASTEDITDVTRYERELAVA